MRVRILLLAVVTLSMLMGPLGDCFANPAKDSPAGSRVSGRADPGINVLGIHSSEASWDFSNASSYTSGGVSAASGMLNLSQELNFTGNRWTRLSDLGGGDQREDFSAAWDDVNDRMIVHGGYYYNGVGNPKWSQPLYTYDPSADSWTKQGDSKLTAGNVGVWDPADQSFITHGGYSTFDDWSVPNPPITGYNCSNETYAWYPADGTWSPCAPGPVRYQHSAVWDPVRNIMLVFGGLFTNKTGIVYTSTYYNDIWRFNLTTNTWTKMTPIGTLPPTRAGHTAVWDTKNGQMIVFGGSNATVNFKDVWTYNYALNRWTQMVAATQARTQHAACWDSDNNVMIVAAGLDNFGGFYNDTWIYNSTGNCWSQAASIPGSGRAGLEAVYDTADRQMILYGGRGSDSNQIVETLAYKYIEWVQKYLPSGSVQSKPLALCETLHSIDRVSWYGNMPPGSNISIKFRASNGNVNLMAFLPLENGSRPVMQGRNVQWNITIQPSADRLESPEISMVKVEYTLNLKPNATAGPAISAYKKTVVTLNCSVADGDGDVLAYNWTKVSGPNVTLSSASVPDPSFTPQQSGSYLFSLVVNDSFVNSTAVTVAVTVLNHIPKASAGANQTGFKNEQVVLHGNGTDDDRDALTYKWTQASGIVLNLTGADQPDLTVLPKALGTYTFQLVVSDGESSSEPSFVSYTVEGQRPVAVLTAASTLLQLNGAAELSGNDSTDPDGKVSRFFFEFGDGKDSGWTNESLVKHTYGRPGAFSATLTVRDDDGIVSEISEPVAITVRNLPPVVVGQVVPLEGNTSTQFRFSVPAGATYDPDGTIVSYVWEFGDGTRATGTVTTHTYKTKGVYEVRFRVTDDLGAYSDAFFNMTIGNRAPALQSAAPSATTTMFLGAELSVSASALDPDNDQLTYSWKVDGQQRAAIGSSLTFKPDTAGEHRIELTISDGELSTVHLWTIKVQARPAPAAADSTAGLLMAAAIVLIAAFAGAGYFVHRRGQKAKAAQAAALALQPAPTPQPQPYYSAPPATGYEQQQYPGAYQQQPPPTAYPYQPFEQSYPQAPQDAAQQPQPTSDASQPPEAATQPPAQNQEDIPMAEPVTESLPSMPGVVPIEAQPVEDGQKPAEPPKKE